jgi:hypothetical protein
MSENPGRNATLLRGLPEKVGSKIETQGDNVIITVFGDFQQFSAKKCFFLQNIQKFFAKIFFFVTLNHTTNYFKYTKQPDKINPH